MNYYFNNMPIVAPLVIQTNEPQFETDTLSLGNYRTGRNAQRWEISFMLRSSDRVRTDLVNRIINYNTPRTMIMPQLTDAIKNSILPSEPITVSTNASFNSDLLQLNLPSQTRLSEGYFIRFSNHSKIYLITSGAENITNVNLIGTAKVGSTLSTSITTSLDNTITIYPHLRQTVPAGTQVLIGSDVLLRYKMKSNTLRGVVYEDGVLADAGAVELFEAL